METITKLFTTVFGNGSIRRWGIGLFVSGLILADGKFHLGLTLETMGMLTAIAIALILGSNLKEAAVVKAEGELAVAQTHVGAREQSSGIIFPGDAPTNQNDAATVVAGIK